MFKQYSQFLIIYGMVSFGIFRKYRSALYFLISALVKIGAIIEPTIRIVITDIIVVTFVELIFCSA